MLDVPVTGGDTVGTVPVQLYPSGSSMNFDGYALVVFRISSSKRHRISEAPYRTVVKVLLGPNESVIVRMRVPASLVVRPYVLRLALVIVVVRVALVRVFTTYITVAAMTVALMVGGLCQDMLLGNPW